MGGAPAMTLRRLLFSWSFFRTVSLDAPAAG
jgi:hypothetical protein